ncbi:MAG: zinc ABC transporter substrate-binding protein [Gammaproteobacteria bacterium]|nr:zinc ABC transporter substrate-binding protein [Gammaproteobacteria bacterium]
MLSRSTVFLGFAILLAGVSGVAQAAFNVFACEPEWAALAQELGGDQLEIYSATTALQDPHHIQARPSLIAKARKADLLVCTGAELEVGWLPLLLRRAGNARIQPGQPGHFLASDYVDMLEVPEMLDRRLGDIHVSGNPHVHTDPRNILGIAGPLSERLKALDPNHADHYQQRYRDFESAWQQAMHDWSERAAGVKGAKIVVHHDFWSYLIDWLEFNKIATLEPVPGVSPSSRHLAQVKQLLQQQPPAMIINTGYMNDRPVKWLSDQMGIPVVSLPASVDFHNQQTLQQWFGNLVELLREPLQ